MLSVAGLTIPFASAHRAAQAGQKDLAMPPLFQSKTASNAPLVVHGGRPLAGSFEVHAAKNAVLPIMGACLLTAEPVTLHRVPRLSDVEVLLEILGSLGARHEWVGRHSLTVEAAHLRSTEAPYVLVSKMRASFEVFGPLLARMGEARVAMPGGCVIGPRPVDQHVKAFRALGVSLSEEGGDFHAVRERPLSGRFVFDLKTVGGTRNAVMAAALGSGRVVLENCALEPEVVDLANFLNGLGARVRGAGTPTIEVEGVERLGGGEYTVIPDRIDAAPSCSRPPPLGGSSPWSG
jgi:UDP-N-acetylglucosamine 1-carboxyvinyltransferase